MSTASNLLDTPVPIRDNIYVKNLVDGSVTLQSPLSDERFLFRQLDEDQCGWQRRLSSPPQAIA